MIFDSKKTARHCTFNGLKFDSLAERDFYVKLCRIFGTDRVSRCGKVEILPPTDSLPGLAWDIDFKVEYKGQIVFVEYKGLIKGRREFHREFFLKYALMRRFQPSMRILVFSPDTLPPKWQTKTGEMNIPSIHRDRLSTFAILDVFNTVIGLVAS